MKPIYIVLLFCIILFAAFLRFYGINWDQGFHLHPDERAIVLYTLPLQIPSSLSNFFSSQSTLNPHFFAYGSLPIYLLKITAFLSSFFDGVLVTYDGINLLGRAMSALFDLGTILLIFFLGKRIFSVPIGLVAAFVYSISVLPIQTSHFYAVDIPLTFFITVAITLLIFFYEKPNQGKSVLIGIFFGLSLATKNSALSLLSSVTIALFADFLLVFIRSPHRPSKWTHYIPIILKRLFFDGLTIITVGIIVFLITEPYSLIDFPNFLSQTSEQSQMTHNAFIFPYTLQYVGKIPYLYELKNIFLWGQGPLLSILSFLGILYIARAIYRKNKTGKWAQEIIILTFVISYFAVVGHFAVGFMRYMLPIYPFLSLFAAVFLWKGSIRLLPKFPYLIAICFLLIALVWPLSFIHIYMSSNTRVLATNWIQQNIKPGSTIAIEHWDDGLPLVGQQNYHMLTLPLYDPDTPEKWSNVNNMLAQTDYIIIASNRLYVPLQKLTNCQTLPLIHCYPTTAKYYNDLFSGNNVIQNQVKNYTGQTIYLNSQNQNVKFEKVAQFAVYPTIPVINLPINDQGADESFTVYDHPIVMIFKNNLRLTQAQ